MDFILARGVESGYNIGVKWQLCGDAVKSTKGDTAVKKKFLAPVAEIVSFLSQEDLMVGASYYGYDEGDIGGLVPGESGAGGSSGWGDF